MTRDKEACMVRPRGAAVFAAALCIVMIWTFACGGRYGAIRLDATVEQAVESYHMDPSLDYFYSGPDLYPNAVIAVKKGYRLAPDTWKPLGTDQRRFRDAVLQMHQKAREYGEIPRGFVMTDHQGVAVGLWYSVIRATTVLRVADDGTLVVYPPELVLFDRGSGGDGAPEKSR